MNTQTTIRYSEEDLVAFKAIIEKKLEKASNQLAYLAEQLSETAESKGSQGDWMDDSTSSNDLDMLQTMANRQRKHIADLKNALQRIHNKSYGICVITRKLIDKRRLMAVPTTTKSLAAKMENAIPEKKQTKPKTKVTSPTNERKIISRIISKPSTTPAIPKNWEEEDELDIELDEDVISVDLDSYSDEDLN